MYPTGTPLVEILDETEEAPIDEVRQGVDEIIGMIEQHCSFFLGLYINQVVDGIILNYLSIE